MGLFGVVDSGTIQNVNIENANIMGGTSERNVFVGGIAGFAGSRTKIENVVVRSSVINYPLRLKKSYGDHRIRKEYVLHMGGCVGYAQGKIDKCINEADLSADCYDYDSCSVGGIVGYGEKKAVLLSSENQGLVKNNSSFTGGICGSGCIIRDAGNEGVVLVNGYSVAVGGLCGADCKVYKSINLGNIESANLIRSQNKFLGGVCGERCIVLNTVNRGNIDIDSVQNGNLYVGGILGYFRGDYLDKISFCGNHGDINAFALDADTAVVYVGGIAGKSEREIVNVYNQGNLKSSHYAAGIVSITAHRVQNFYVAVDSIKAPYASPFVYKNTETDTNDIIMKNGYLDEKIRLDTIILKSPLNVGVVESLFIRNTEEMQMDSFAFVLDVFNLRGAKPCFYRACGYDINEWGLWSEADSHWSREEGYPIFSDSVHKPIYQVLFVRSVNDTIYKWTNYKGQITSIPKLDGNKIWDDFVDENSVFDWEDSVVIAKCVYSSSSSMNSSSSANVLYYEDEPLYGNSSSDYALSSSDEANTPTGVTSLIPNQQFTIQVSGRNLRVTKASNGVVYIVFDMQGRVLKQGRIESANVYVSMPMAGSYLVRVGNQIQRVNIR